MTPNIRKPVLTLGILAALIGLLGAGCSSSDSEVAVVKPTVATEPATGTKTSEKAEDTSSPAVPQPKLVIEDVSTRAEVGEDVVAVEDRSGTTTVDTAATPLEIEIGRPYGEDRSGTTVAQTAATPIEIEIGMPYAEARWRLLQQGWVPEEGPEPPSGVERTLYEAGFTEVEACSGTGLGPCIFNFSHPERTGLNEENILRVVTTGGASNPNISGWSTDLDSGTPPTTAANTAVVAEIPVPFQGTWDGSVEGCSMPVTDGRMWLESDSVQYYESLGPVTEVVTQGDSIITIYAELSSEGSDYYTSARTFELSEDGLSLTDNDSDLVWYRCPDV